MNKKIIFPIIIVMIFLFSLTSVIGAISPPNNLNGYNRYNIKNYNNITGDLINNVYYVDANEGSDIQTKIDLCPATGCTVIIPEGEYTYTDRIEIDNMDYFTLKGSKNTRLISAGTANIGVFINDSNYVTIRDLDWDMGGRGHWLVYNAGIADIVNTGLLVENNRVYNNGLYGFLFAGSDSVGVNYTVNEVRINANDYVGSCNGISVTGSKSIITNNKIIGCGNLSTSTTEWGEGIEVNKREDAWTFISGNYIAGFAEQGIDLNSNIATISNNIFNYTGTTGNPAYNQTFSTCLAVHAHKVSVTGNIFIGCETFAIDLRKSTLGTVTGNTIVGRNSGVGISLGNVENVVVMGNAVSNVTTAIDGTTLVALYNNSVMGNTFGEGVTNKILLPADSTNYIMVDDTFYNDITISNEEANLYVTSTAGNAGARFTASDNQSAFIELYADEGAGGSDRFRIEYNDNENALKFMYNNLPYHYFYNSGDTSFGGAQFSVDYGLSLRQPATVVRVDDTILGGNTLGKYFFGGEGTSGTDYESASIEAYVPSTWTGDGDTPTDLQFFVTPDGSGNALHRLTLDGDGNLIPATNGIQSLGTADKQWSALHVVGSTIYLGGVPLSIEGDELFVDGVSLQSGRLKIPETLPEDNVEPSLLEIISDFVLENEDTVGNYICPDNERIIRCTGNEKHNDALSGTGKTCYITVDGESTYRRCSSAWKIQ